MSNPLASWVLLSWFPIVLVLVWALGPRRSAAIAILGGFLFLPRFASWEILGTVTIDKRHIPGLAFLAAVLLFDRPTLFQARPGWWDLPMVAFVIAPMITSLVHRIVQIGPSADQSLQILAQWAIPYGIARLYYDDADGPRRLAGAIVIGGLIYVPICWFETIAGPRWYLSGLLYGIQYYGGMVERLGGYRPEGFLGHGIELAAWMALTTVIAFWLWLSRSGWRCFGLPSWVVGLMAMTLGATTIACRGVFGYAVLALGLLAALITIVFRTRLLLIVLLLIPPSYIVARATGAWDGRQMSEIAGRMHREGTIKDRLKSENQFVMETKARDIAFGFGGRAPYWQADSWWVTALKGGGVVGLVTQYAAFLLPATLVIFGPRHRFSSRSVEMGLALLIVVLMLDSLLNTSMIAALPLMGGTLVSAFLAHRAQSSRPDEWGRGATGPDKVRRPRTPFPVAFVSTLIVLAALEVLGRWPRTPRLGETTGAAPEPVTNPSPVDPARP